MKKSLLFFICLFLLTFDVDAVCSDTSNVSERIISEFLSRIIVQEPTANSQLPILTILDENLVQQPIANSQQSDVFIITTKDGKPCVKGNSISAITTGINWYLNHYAKINLSWNNLYINNLSAHNFPLHTEE